jgi:hypothetical protein
MTNVMNVEPVLDQYVVHITDVCEKLSKLKKNKTTAPDCIPNKIYR